MKTPRRSLDFKDVISLSKTFTAIDPEMDKRVMQMANSTWDCIGGDVLEANEGKDMPRSHVIECVSDADYMYTNGCDHEAYAYFLFLNETHPKHKEKVMKEAFPFKKYGL